MHKATMTMAVVTTLWLTGCGDDGGGEAGGTEAGTTEAGTTEAGTTEAGTTEATTEAVTTGDESTEGPTTGEESLTPAALVGRWESAGCEAYPDGMGGTNYLTRGFTLTETTWHLDLGLFMDEACATPLFSAVIDGPYTLGGASAAVAGATEGEFAFTKIVWTAHQAFMADTFTQAGCGAAPWEVEVPQEVTQTGCIGVAHPVADCPQEYDIVALTGDDLFFGARVTDMCEPEGRPTALAPFPVVRQ